MPPRNEKAFAAGLVGIFLLANLLIFSLADPSCYQFNGACANQHDIYGTPTAKTLLEHGWIVDPSNSAEPWTYRQWPPLYGSVMAVSLLISGGKNFLPLVGIQLLMVLLTAMIAREVLLGINRTAANTVAPLLLFNPNVLGGAHLLQNETMYMFLLMLAFWMIWRHAQNPRTRYAILFGIILGFAALTRPSIQYLLPLIPLAFVIVGVLGPKSRLVRSVVHGTIATGALACVLAPWIAFQINAGVGWRLAGPGLESLYWINNLKYMTEASPGEGDQVWKSAFEAKQSERLRNQFSDWDSLNEVERGKLELNDTLDYVRTTPFTLKTLIIAEAKATARFFLIGGEGEIHSLFGIELQPEKNPIAFYGIKAVAVAYAVALRLLGLVGIIYLVKRRSYPLLFLSLSVIGYTWLSHFVLAKPRFRIPVEPELAILAAAGVIALLSWVERPKASAF